MKTLAELLNIPKIIIRVENSSGDLLGVFSPEEFCKKEVIYRLHQNLTANYGTILPNAEICRIVADTFDVSTTYVRDCCRFIREKEHAARAERNAEA